MGVHIIEKCLDGHLIDNNWEKTIMDSQIEQPWRWCLVGNIVNSHKYGESKDVMIGTKHFQPGAKVYMAPPNWGDGYENIVVIGCPRRSKRYIEIITKSEYIKNCRIQKVYKPFILKMMDNSRFRWWNDSEDDQKNIQSMIESMNTFRSKEPEVAE